MPAADKTDYKQLLSFIMHDLREVNAMIRDSARLLSVSTREQHFDEQSVRHHVSIIFEQSAVLASWLAIADMHIDPDRFGKEPLARVSLHEIFYKALKNFKRLAAAKHIKLSLNGEGKFYVEAHAIIDIMPCVLLDNAVKYSPEYGKIEVTLEEGSSAQHIVVESMGPCMDEHECNSLFVVGFRGKYAQQRTQVGTGQGLALLKTICASHGGNVTAASGKMAVVLNDVPYGVFSVDIRIPRDGF